MVANALQALWVESRPERPPVRVWQDWLLVGLLLTWVVLEALLREDRSSGMADGTCTECLASPGGVEERGDATTGRGASTLPLFTPWINQRLLLAVARRSVLSGADLSA